MSMFNQLHTKTAVVVLAFVIFASIYYGVRSSFEINVSLKQEKSPPVFLLQSESSHNKEKIVIPAHPCVPLSTPSTTKKIGRHARARGIVRTLDEQRIEAIEILSLAMESAAAKNRKLLDGDRKCDWTNGTWVKDASIKHAESFLKGYEKCRVDPRQNCKRKNLNDSYLGYRWVLNDAGCEAKRVRFTRKLFLSTVRNKRIAIIGDSLTRNMFQSLACLLHVPDDKGKMIEDHMFRYRYPDFRVTIEFIRSNYLVNQTRKNCDSYSSKKLALQPCLDVKNVDEAWKKRVKDFDIFLFATGGWWEHDLQMGQVLGRDRSYQASSTVMREAFATVTNYLARPEFEEKELYWRCSEVSHFFGGEWNSGGECLRNNPSDHSLYNPSSLFIQEAVIDALFNSLSSIKLLDITKMSSYRQDAHPSSQSKNEGAADCKHWCLPGIPDHWNEVWLNMLRDRKQSI